MSDDRELTSHERERREWLAAVAAKNRAEVFGEIEPVPVRRSAPTPVSVPISLRVDSDLAARLQQLAEQELLSVSALVRRIRAVAVGNGSSRRASAGTTAASRHH